MAKDEYRGRKLALVWTSHTRDQKEKEAVENSIMASSTMRERLLSIIDQHLQAIDSQQMGLADFEDAAWAYKQAYRNGEKRSFLLIKELLSFDRN